MKLWRIRHSPGASIGRWSKHLLIFWTVASLLAPSPFIVNAKSPMWHKYTYNDPTGSRLYFVYTPVNYQFGKAVPLVVMLHGCGQTALNFALGTRMNQLADEHQFIVMYPQQIITSNPNLCWNWFNPANQVRGSGEPAMIVGIIETMQQNTAQWTIDTRRIYVAGVSAGAAMAVILGATYPDIFAAIGVHSGVEYQAATGRIKAVKAMRQGGPDPVEQGQAAYDAMGAFAHVVPTIVFQGTGDNIVNSVNGDQVVQQWMQTDALASKSTYQADFYNPSSNTVGQVPDGHSYTTYTWNDRAGSEIQEYWKIKGMGHGWSGGSPNASYTDPQGPDASQAMYTFFMNHPMPMDKTRGQASFWGKLRRTLVDWFKTEFG